MQKAFGSAQGCNIPHVYGICRHVAPFGMAGQSMESPQRRMADRIRGVLVTAIPCTRVAAALSKKASGRGFRSQRTDGMSWRSGFGLIPAPAKIVAALAFALFFFGIFEGYRASGLGTLMGLVGGTLGGAYFLLAGYIYADAVRRGMPP